MNQTAVMPTIRLGSLEVSRLILGSNPFFGFTHDNPQASSQEMKQFCTNDQIMAVMDAAAGEGVTAVWTPPYDEWVKLWNDYRAQGGKLRHWIAQPDRPGMETELRAAIQGGASAVCIQGEQVDAQVQQGKWEVIEGWIALVKEHGLPVGIASHTATTHLAAQERGLGVEFYHQTLYRPENYVRAGLEESLAVIERIAKPVVAYKALGAGRILPKDTLPYIFSRLKPKDGICLGVFPKRHDEIAENAGWVRRLSRG